jgi:outer membrane lipoprotein LolB
MKLPLLMAAAAAAMLAACAAPPVRPDLTPAQRADAAAAQDAREQVLRADGEWTLTGRIAVSNQGKGGSGRIEWSQDGARYRVSLSAPVTRQSWHLSGDRDRALLEGLDGGPRAGTNARLLLLQATGWDIPVAALAEWVRGARAQALGPARVEYGAGGLPWRIEQGGWQIEYEWPDTDPLAPAATPMLPSRLEATRGEATVKLIVDEWNAP